ncbi:protocadherin gamma-A7-like isoform X9 [Trichosurus vulpecula]|uniref:protocadherin gamma-A7-like isoform X9 n=1 Tax=Trichosurus vulpecula TaxID=9337 RepID=UPI00186B2E30|nr:protocadherin gamma-A7-like isoform X9 [Trichosurus vulpecula]
MAAEQKLGNHRRQVILLCFLLETLRETGARKILYSVPEEMEKGSFVGDIAKDLGLEPWELSERGARIVFRGRTQPFALNVKTGSLVTEDVIDREELCAQSAQCLVGFELLVEDRMDLYSIEVEIKDINDNTPRFQAEELDVKINENAAQGEQFGLPSAWDADVGVNSLQNYELSPSNHFSLLVRTGEDGAKYSELVLEQALDREEEPVYHLTLMASDGGDPALSGTVRIRVIVLDLNDNTPVFTQSIYHVSVSENVPVGTVLLRVNATDRDEGFNGEVTYSFQNLKRPVSDIFYLDSHTGEIVTKQSLDYEKTKLYELKIQANDGPGLSGSAKVSVKVVDVNDNAPEVTVTSFTSSVPENSSPGTIVALFNLHDRDSGENGYVICSIPANLPFKLQRSLSNYQRLVTEGVLDREQISEYNITMTASDQGTPPLFTVTQLSLRITDINDNPPSFSQTSYSVYILENNPRSSSIYSMTARDPDSEENSRITYSIEGDVQRDYVSINSETGVIYALRSFDYELVQHLQLRVIARDSGDPPLSSNVSLTLFILDQNDNAPEILYPTFPTDGSTGVELAPRSAEPGYLVTKVVAVDKDSGQNAWLSYSLLKVTEPGLFSVGLHTGEVRTARNFADKDILKQKLVVAVTDNGEPSLSTTVSITVAVADSIPEIFSDLSNLEAPKSSDDSSLTFYLVIAVTAVSCLFLIFIIVLLTFRLCQCGTSQLLESTNDYVGDVPDTQFAGMDGVRAFLQTYSHQVSLSTDSPKSQLISPQPNYADTLLSIQSCDKKEPLSTTSDLQECKDESAFVQQAPPNTDWRFSQAQRPGTSGSQNGDEGGTWPNNQFDTEMLQAMILASANEAADGSSTLGGGAGTMGLSARYGPQFTLQHVPDYRQNVYIPGSTATLANAAGKRDGKATAGGNGNKKKSGKKEKK